MKQNTEEFRDFAKLNKPNANNSVFALPPGDFFLQGKARKNLQVARQ